MNPESIVEKTLAELLAEFRATATSDSDKGTKFERLTKFYLIKDPIWSEQLANVRLREEAGIGPDVGIDLVADDIASGGKVAIQCKFYDERTYLDDLGTFYTSSGKDGYVKRIVVTTSNQWTRNAEEALKNQQIPVQRILLHDMERSLISWGAFDLTQNYGSVPIAQKELRPHQIDALTAVMDGFKEADRGKVIMACGTGKTLVSLRIAEEFFKKKKTPSTVLFLAPSISLLSQTIMEWGQNKKSPYMALAVCSDAKVGKKDDDDMQVTDLAIPASTDVEKLAAALANRGTKNLVIFSTYQSLEIISKAQNGKKNPLSEFDLVVCDEAHRTTGVTTAAKAAVEDFSHFVRIHDNGYVKASKRLYMTATPKIYKDVDNKVTESGGVIASMDDPEKFGEEFYRLGFGTAVERGLLSDYRVLILAVDEEYVARVDLERFRSEDSTINLDDASKLLGCWRGLSKIKTQGEDVDDIPMKRAVAFANTIDASQVLAKRLEIVGRTANRPTEGNQGLSLQTKHVDGKQNALVRRQSLEWLKADPGQQTARILTNARCLSEGIDVPALDAVIFTEARGSQVDIVQAVGRVMRKYEGKNSGYIILPVAITAGADINSTLKGTKYKVIWDVLNALRAHDDRFDVIVNQINLNQDRDSKIEVDVITGDDEEDVTAAEEFEQGILVHLPSQIADGIYAKIVEKVGERDYWEKWAKDIADIAHKQEIRIRALLKDPKSKSSKEFEKFLKGLRESLNDSISRDDAIEMLAQHLITLPIFDALFLNSGFAQNNPVSKTMDRILKLLQGHIEADEKLDRFYESVRKRVEGIDNNASRQKLVIDLYERFFKIAFPRMTEKLGIVYTPIEIVDFIINSVEKVLKDQFKTSLNDKKVSVLDPFTGTGTFIVRLMQSGLIDKDNLPYKYHNEIHANEIILLAYYIGAINIESTFAELSDESYTPFDGIVLADTFEMYEKDDKLDLDVFISNNERAEKQKSKDIRVIIGNPPYSVGQNNQNDNNENVTYPELDAKIAGTYVRQSKSGNGKQAYDSYIRAFRWATDRVGKSGVVAFVSNGRFIDAKSLDGFRHEITREFDQVFVLNLRGNQRTQGEESRKEGGKVFGSGSRTPVAITILVKGGVSKSTEPQVHYAEIGEYLTREQKLERLSTMGDISHVSWELISVVGSDEWINVANEELMKFDPMGQKKDPSGNEIFPKYGLGTFTTRDSWAYNFSKKELSKNVKSMISNYNEVVGKIDEKNRGDKPIEDRAKKLIEENSDTTKISWDVSLIKHLKNKKILKYDESCLRVGLYRPFCKKHIYFEKGFLRDISNPVQFFPTPDTKNLVMSVGTYALKPFGLIMTDVVPDLQLTPNGQCFPLLTYASNRKQDSLFDLSDSEDEKTFNVSDVTLRKYQKLLGSEISKEDIFFYVYGLLHSNEYRAKFKNELGTSLPRIPIVSDFDSFSRAGKRLSDLHVGYEMVSPYELEGASISDFMGDFKVEKMRFDTQNGKPDKSRIIINGAGVLQGIPDLAHRYDLYGRSAIEWVLDRYEIKKDSKTEIIQDPNDWFLENDSPVKHLMKVINVSVQSSEIIDKLPKLEIL
jgi:predicted helicase